MFLSKRKPCKSLKEKEELIIRRLVHCLFHETPQLKYTQALESRGPHAVRMLSSSLLSEPSYSSLHVCFVLFLYTLTLSVFLGPHRGHFLILSWRSVELPSRSQTQILAKKALALHDEVTILIPVNCGQKRGSYGQDVAALNFAPENGRVKHIPDKKVIGLKPTRYLGTWAQKQFLQT